MQDPYKYIRQSPERHVGERKNGRGCRPCKEKETGLLSLTRKAYRIPELTDEELQDAADGYEKFSKRHDVDGDWSILRMRYFVRMAYFFGYITGRKGEDPS